MNTSKEEEEVMVAMVAVEGVVATTEVMADVADTTMVTVGEVMVVTAVEVMMATEEGEATMIVAMEETSAAMGALLLVALVEGVAPPLTLMPEAMVTEAPTSGAMILEALLSQVTTPLQVMVMTVQGPLGPSQQRPLVRLPVPPTVARLPPLHPMAVAATADNPLPEPTTLITPTKTNNTRRHASRLSAPRLFLLIRILNETRGNWLERTRRDGWNGRRCLDMQMNEWVDGCKKLKLG
eukprot:gb/GEZN01014465.1/.p1 GENE.gb/GEZN01014465.1/~~gb/GEZN01014465.1/.p1  ORF type:complete len:238 (-),score=28.96 gb/GEZN01014465.1/:75-788(-)